MQVKSILQTGGAIVFGLSTATSIILDVSEAPSQGIAWQWYALFAFFVFCIIISWIIYEKQRQISELEDKRPLITIATSVNEPRWAHLVVGNEGKYLAKFGVTITRLGQLGRDKNHVNVPYSAAWRKANPHEHLRLFSIESGGKAFLNIATVLENSQSKSESTIKPMSATAPRGFGGFVVPFNSLILVEFFVTSEPKAKFSIENMRYLVHVGDNGLFDDFGEYDEVIKKQEPRI